MRYLFILLLLIPTTAHSTKLSQEFELLSRQQACFHKDENRDYQSMLLSEWKAEMADRKYTAKFTYLFWAESKEKDNWINAFMARLKADLIALGVTIQDRVANRKGKPDIYNDIEPVVTTAKVLLIQTQDSSLAFEGSTKFDCWREWKYVEDRLKDDLHPMHWRGDNKTLGPNTVLPIVIAGPEIYLNGLIKDYKGKMLDSERLSSFNYFQLLIRLSRFIYDMPPEVDCFTKTLGMLLSARPDFRRELGM
jgi:hypothetical protein